MRKFLLLLVFLISLLSISRSIQAAAPQPSQNKRWVCLDAQRCGDCDDINGDGLDDPESCYIYDGVTCNSNLGDLASYDHRARLKQAVGSELLPGKDTYIVDCLAAADGDRCTTGTSATDLIVYGVDNYSTMQNDPAILYTFEGLYNADGSLRDLNYVPASETFSEYEWQDGTPAGFERKFYGLNYVDPEVAAGGITGEAASQQQASLEFSFDNVSNAQNCISVHWDPYGRIFDSQTLEPIKGAKVTLLMERKDLSFTQVTPSDIVGGAITNPYTTKEDGVFNFVVPAGNYKITVQHPDYDFPSSSSVLNPNYKKIYWQIYPSQTGEIIKEAPPKLEYRDIPLDPKNISMMNDIKLMEYSYTKNKVTGKSIVEGRVSQPYAIIKAYSVKSGAKYRLLITQQADKMGRFKIEIDETKFEKGETFGEVEYYKIDLTKNLDQKNSSLTSQVSQFLKLDPILNYLEGYAYDQTGKILANATVSVYLKFSNKPYYTTKTNEEGYYKISSEHLPFFPYEIRYTESNRTIVKLSTTDFINQNSLFISDQEINLNAFKDDKGQTFVKKPVTNIQNNNSAPTDQSKVILTNQNKTFLINAVILLILVSGGAVFLGIFIYKKNH